MPQHRKKDCTAKAYLSLSVYLYLLVYDGTYTQITKSKTTFGDGVFVCREQNVWRREPAPVGRTVQMIHGLPLRWVNQSRLHLRGFNSQPNQIIVVSVLWSKCQNEENRWKIEIFLFIYRKNIAFCFILNKENSQVSFLDVMKKKNIFKEKNKGNNYSV